jgi:gamma-glutamylcyclotransferase (GGCT)/AIG2-like uncharacterized protein YtfP
MSARRLVDGRLGVAGAAGGELGRERPPVLRSFRPLIAPVRGVGCGGGHREGQRRGQGDDNLHEFLPAEESCFPIVGWRAAFGSAACGGRALSFLGRGLYALGLFCYGGDMTGTDLLFVYGTLRRGCGSVEAQRLHAQATWLGQGRVRGRLYRVDWYPALVACRSGGDEVTGDAMRSGGRVVEGARLESEYTSKAYRGFESLPLRQPVPPLVSSR